MLSLVQKRHSNPVDPHFSWCQEPLAGSRRTHVRDPAPTTIATAGQKRADPEFIVEWSLGGDAQTFSATWNLADGTPVWTEPYTSLWQLGDEEANSRIWGGIHFRIDIDSAQGSCVQVADNLSENFMRRARH